MARLISIILSRFLFYKSNRASVSIRFHHMNEQHRSPTFPMFSRTTHCSLRPFSPAIPSTGIWNEYSSYRWEAVYSFRLLLLSLSASSGHTASFFVFPCRTNTWNWKKKRIDSAVLVPSSLISYTLSALSIKQPKTSAQCALFPFFRHGEWLKSESYLFRA